MTYLIAEPRIDVKDKACACNHPAGCPADRAAWAACR
jgi:hypothetical protein